MNSNSTRRQFIRMSTIVSAGLLVAGCRSGSNENSRMTTSDQSPGKADQNQMGGEVTATEDLMREHVYFAGLFLKQNFHRIAGNPRWAA